MTGAAQQLYRMLVQRGHAELDAVSLPLLYQADTSH